MACIGTLDQTHQLGPGGTKISKCSEFTELLQVSDAKSPTKVQRWKLQISPSSCAAEFNLITKLDPAHVGTLFEAVNDVTIVWCVECTNVITTGRYRQKM